MQQMKVTYPHDSKNCVADCVSTSFNGDIRVLAKHINDAYTAAGVEVLMISKIEEVEIGLM